MYELEDEDRAAEVARRRTTTSPSGIGAAYISETTERDRDGWRGVVAVSDGEQSGVIHVAAAGHDGFRGMPVNGEALASLVERRAGDFPRHSRFADLMAATAEGHGLRLDSIYPDEWRRVRDIP